ncbi:hypothetical protein [Sandarakinorhabdus sp.]|jgi:hypothetical protein|uniref:hypothetical protein n=1 Tax=Sandarakinorhabdus sp. TaxID=1916663 RepID=UPI0035691FEA
MNRTARLMATALVAATAASAVAFPLVVVEARGGQLRPGARVDSASSLILKVGERVVLVAPDGRVTNVQGPHNGPPTVAAGAVQNPRLALAALIATRNDRANTVGAVRSGALAAPLPSPWLIDVSRPGERCIRDDAPPVWWRPAAGDAAAFVIYPVDRSWRADFLWDAGQTKITAPALLKLDGAKMIVIKTGTQERAVRLNIIPADIQDPAVLVAWMLEKACVQQADALLRQIEAGLAAEPALPPS